MHTGVQLVVNGLVIVSHQAGGAQVPGNGTGQSQFNANGYLVSGDSVLTGLGITGINANGSLEPGGTLTVGVRYGASSVTVNTAAAVFDTHYACRVTGYTECP